jgi:phage anti-repressor protein
MLQDQLNTAVETINTVDFSLIEIKPNGKISARNLYKFLGLKQSDVARWLNSKIVKNKFAIENEDYWGFSIVAEGNQTMDYDLTTSFAKKLCMMSKSKNGESARNYFLECEKKANQKQVSPAPLTIEQVLELNSKVINQLQQKVEVLETEKQILLPKAKFVDDTFIDSNPALTPMKVVAHECGVSIQKLYKLLRERKVWFYALSEFSTMENNVMAKYIKSGHFKIKQTWSDRHKRHFDKIFATSKGKLLCYEITQDFTLQLAS